MKIALGFINNANMAFLYAKSLSSAGADVHCVLFNSNPFGYVSDISETYTVKYFSNQSLAFSYTLSGSFDIFINLASTGGTPHELEQFYVDLISRNTRIVTIHLGSDSRFSCLSDTIYYIKSLKPSTFSDMQNLMAADVALRITYVQLAEKYSTLVIDNPFSWHLHSSKYINFHYIGIPVIREFLPNYELPVNIDEQTRSSRSHQNINITHIPSNRHVKGSSYIDSVVNKFVSINPRLNINYLSVRQRVPNTHIQQILAKTDIYIDQAYSDLPLSVSATEAISFGIPTISLGSYLCHPQLWELHSVKTPTFYGRPPSLFHYLTEAVNVLSDPKSLSIIKRKCSSWYAVHSPNILGKRLHQLISDSLNLDYVSFSSRYENYIVDPSSCHLTEVSFHPEYLFRHLARQQFYIPSLKVLTRNSYYRTASLFLSKLQSSN